MVLFEKVPVAVNCCVVPRAMLGVAGVTAMDASVALVTVKVAVPDMSPEVAVMVVVPAATDAARPALLIVATAVSDELHVADAVKSCVVLSEYVPVAVNCCVVPRAMLRAGRRYRNRDQRSGTTAPAPAAATTCQ